MYTFRITDFACRGQRHWERRVEGGTRVRDSICYEQVESLMIQDTTCSYVTDTGRGEESEGHTTETRRVMRWLRLVGSVKLYVSFAKEPSKRDHILLTRPIILRSLLIVATPYARDTGRGESSEGHTTEARRVMRWLE